MLYSSSSPRPYAVRKYQQKRKRQQRLLLLALACFTVFMLVGMAIWGICQAAPSFLKPLDTHTEAFQALLDREFGLSSTPSLLYYQNLDYALAAQRPMSPISQVLLPLWSTGEDAVLKSRLEQMLAQYPANRFITHFYFYNPQNNTSVEINGYAPVPAASVIKLPILLDYLMSLDEHVLTPDTMLYYADFHRAGGAGELQYRDSGVNFLANDVASQMIRISDNTCTNMMISYLGGTDAVNHRLAQLGLVHTRIRNWLPDLTGTNTISPYEMVSILYNLDRGRPLVSDETRQTGLDILKSTHNRRLLVATLPQDATVAHKTGDIGTALGDSGIVYLPDGRKYFVSMQVERPYNDYTARDMVQKTSRMVYDYVQAQAPAAPVLEPIQASSR